MVREFDFKRVSWRSFGGNEEISSVGDCSGGYTNPCISQNSQLHQIEWTLVYIN